MYTMTGAATCGRMMPHQVSTSPSATISANSGAISTCGGTMIPARITASSTRRPRNWVRAKPYAAIAENSTVMTVTTTAVTVELIAHLTMPPVPRTRR
ncbi:hypothetical protein ACFQX6_64540 [Streptosporangium lutulentum]